MEKPSEDQIVLDVTAEIHDAVFYYPGYSALNGKIIGDTKGRFKDNTRIRTSEIKNIYVETENSVYKVKMLETNQEIATKALEKISRITLSKFLSIETMNKKREEILLEALTLISTKRNF